MKQAKALAASTGAALGLLTLPSVANAAETPVETGCPAGYAVLSVAELTPQGYRVPAFLDNPVNGGNGDGLVCGLPLPEAFKEARFPNASVAVIYLFADNNNPAQFAPGHLEG
jgi:hypothetical protein